MSDLISREAIHTKVKQIANDCYNEPAITAMAALSDVCDAILTAPAGMRWVSVTEATPDTDHFVLGIVDSKYGNSTFQNAIQLVEYDGSDWFLDGYPNIDAVNVTHWMPLPEGPNGKEAE